jgi:hypothetical protein
VFKRSSQEKDDGEKDPTAISIPVAQLCPDRLYAANACAGRYMAVGRTPLTGALIIWP